jgi:uncharacterized membrane protein YhaH (DUF805 family)
MTMTFGQAIKHVFSNYATFQGRASRSEFWWWYLFTSIVSMIVFIPVIPWYNDLINSSLNQAGDAVMVMPPITGLATVGLVLSTIWSLAILIPTIAVGARRLHDSNKSAWLWLLWFLSCCFGIGSIILIILWILPSTPGPNRYGEGPAQSI